MSNNPSGFRDRILRVDLSTGRTAVESPGEDFFRLYLGGGSIGTYYLLRETDPQTDPFDPANVLTIAPGVTTGAAVSGVSRCCVTALSPMTSTVGDGQAGGTIGPAIKRAGYDAIVITGCADRPSYLYIEDDKVEIRDAAHLAGRTILEGYDALTGELGMKKLSILQCGPAGENRVRFAALLADRNDVVGRKGMGAVFGSKNLRAVAVRWSGDVPFADSKGLVELNRRSAKRLPDAGFPAILRKHGTPGVVAFQAESGNLASDNYSRGWTKDYRQLDAGSFPPDLPAGATTCYGCVVRCRKRVKAQTPFPVTDRLGGPEFETLGLLGSNLKITDPVAVAHANELCNNLGLDTITTGGLAGYLFEASEAGLLSDDKVGDLQGHTLRFGDPETLFWLIRQIASRQGVGDVLADGFRPAIAHFGDATAPLAVHVKNDGFAVHMPQVKPSLALIYAVCPIGPDHQSSEHDWLLTSVSDESRGLGILGQADAASTGFDKVRMAAQSQHYYSALDALSLCMFCWGPGNLFRYTELEELLLYTTGWQMTFYEIMKAGERRTNMMRQLNRRRGFSRADDCLPARVFEPLPDGPSAGRHVDRADFERMLDQYYALMGWHPETGHPSLGKLLELGLEWTLPTS